MDATASPDTFPLLRAPLELGARRLRNRFVLAPMSVCYADAEGYVSAAMIGHYARRAAGGAAMVITENIAVSEAGRQLPRQAMIGEERFRGGLTELAGEIKEQGALAVVQIVHAGRYAGPWDEYGARRRLAPSAVGFELRPDEHVCPDEMTPDEIEESIGEFARAAAQAREAGFDGVEIHGGQGFLISSFLSPAMNQRQDDYGLDRTLFARKVAAAVLEAAGPDMFVGYHLMSDEMTPGGWSADEAVELASTLGRLGISFMIPVATTFESLRRVGAERGLAFNPELTARISAATAATVIANGGLGDPYAAERVVASGVAAAVALARPLFSDPDLPRKALLGQIANRIVCPCNPPTCLMTQLTGSVCGSWPEPVRKCGSWGMHVNPEEDPCP